MSNQESIPAEIIEDTPAVEPQKEAETPTDVATPKKELKVQDAEKALSSTLNREISPQERLNLLQKTIFNWFSISEIALTVQRAQAMGLDILAGEMWAYKDQKGNLINVVAHKYLVEKAQENPDVSSIQSWVVYEGDEYEMNQATWEVKHITKHAFKKDKKPIGAWCIVWQKDWKPYCVEAGSEYDKKVFTWESHKAGMFRKTAEGIACKRFVKSTVQFLAEGEFTPVENTEKRMPKKPDLSQIK